MSNSGSIERSFLADSSIYLSATVLSAAISFITLPIYTRYLSLADFGIVALFGMFGMMVSGLLSIGIQSATYRYYFKFKEDTDSFKTLNSTNLVFLLLVFLFSGVGVYHLAFWFSSTLFDNQITEKIIRLSFLSGCINYFITYISFLLTAQKRSSAFAVVTISRVLINTGFSFYFIFMDSLTYMARIYAIILTQTIMVGVLFFLIRDLVGIRFSMSGLKKSLRYSYPLIPRQIIGLTYKSFDKIFLNKYIGITSVGYYSLGAQFATSIKMLMDSIGKVYTPFFLINAKENTQDSKNKIVIRYYELAFLLMFFSLGIIYFSEELIKLLTTKEFYPAMYIVPIYIYFHLFGILGMISICQMMHAEKLNYILPASIVSIIINIILNIILIPILGAVGAAIATAIAALGVGCTNLYFAQRVYPLPLGIFKLVRLYLLIAFFTVLIYPLMMIEINFLLKIAVKIIFISFFFRIGISLNYITKEKIAIILNRIKQKGKIFAAV